MVGRIRSITSVGDLRGNIVTLDRLNEDRHGRRRCRWGSNTTNIAAKNICAISPNATVAGARSSSDTARGSVWRCGVCASFGRQ